MKLMLKWSVLIAVQLVGCSRYPGLFFTEHTHVGAQIKLSPTENKPLNVNIGYDRGLLAVVPRTESGKNAASVISKTDLEIVLATNSLAKNVFATGAAARNITYVPERIEALFGICRASATIDDRKDKAREKLKTIKGDAEKLGSLYKKVYPKGKADKKDVQYEELSARLSGICDPERDLKVLSMYEDLQGSS